MASELLTLLPEELRRILGAMDAGIWDNLEEIRVRQDRPLEVVYGGGYAFLDRRGALNASPAEAFRPSREACLKLLDLLTQHSVYSYEEELKQGFITIRGGHRVGLSGRAGIEQGKVKLLKEVTGFNLRLAREIRGAARRLLPGLHNPGSRLPHSALIISPPQQGKTTVLRDAARSISSGEDEAGAASRTGRGLKVGIIDERSEIAGSVNGVPTFDVGPRTDVLDACPKAEGMMMFIRSMSPDVLVVDEIGKPEDAAAILDAMRTGVAVIATAHGRDLADIRSRPVMGELLRQGVFTRFAVLSRRTGEEPAFDIFDDSGRRVFARRPADAAAGGKGGGLC